MSAENITARETDNADFFNGNNTYNDKVLSFHNDKTLLWGWNFELAKTLLWINYIELKENISEMFTCYYMHIYIIDTFRSSTTQ